MRSYINSWNLSFVILIIASLISLVYISAGQIPIDQFGLSLLYTFVELAIGAVITLLIIERAITRDRERQWALLKEITNQGILYNLRQIAAVMAVAIRGCSVGGIGGIKIPDEIWNVLWHPSTQTEKQVYSAIIELAELLSKYSYDSRYVRKEAWFSEEWANAEKRRRDGLLGFYSAISKSLDDIRLLYIPRALTLSNDKDLISLYLIQLDIACSRLQSASIFPQQEEKMGIVIGAETCEVFINELIQFLKDSGRIYGIMQQEDEFKIKADEAGAYYSRW